MLAAALALIAGIATGTVTGLLPGLHPNSVVFLLLPVYLATQPPLLPFIAFTVGMSVVHTFVSFIPSTLLGAPEGDTALAVLPGHQELQQGRGLDAILLSVHGGLIAATVALLTLPVLFVAVPPVYAAAQQVMPLLLAGVLAFLLLQHDHRLRAAGVIGLAGLLGTLVLHAPQANSQYILFPLFAGMFGVSTLLVALLQDTHVPAQAATARTPLTASVRGGVLGYCAGLIAGFLPGIGASQSALLVRSASGMNRRSFIVALGGITTADLFLSILAIAVIGNPRSGAAVAIQRVAGSLPLYRLLTIIGMAMIAVGAGALLTRRLARPALTVVTRLPYDRILQGVIGFLAAATLLLTGPFGGLVLVTATGLGLAAHTHGVRKSTLMAALIVPTILSYLGVAVGPLLA